MEAFMKSAYRVALVSSLLAFGTTLWAQPQPLRTPSRPQVYGTSAVSYVRVSPVEFHPNGTPTNYTQGNYFMRYSYNNSSFAAFSAPLHLPSGAKIVYLELDFLDGTASAAEYGSLWACDFNFQNCTQYPTAGAGPGDCLLPGYICSGTVFSAGYSFESVDLSSAGLTVDNVNNSYIVTAGNGSLDSTTEIGGILVGYVLQVSPAPLSATFVDVPDTDFAYQFIEAFSAAGITAGCETSPAKYCPDRNVTRREMAVFFAKALGLQFP
jgi:hypothetical protein